MRKAVLIIVVLVIGTFFLFFDITFESDPSLDFVNKYQTETGHSEFSAEKVYSTNKDESGVRLTFKNCQMDSTNFRSFGDLGLRIAKEIHKQINTSGEYNNVILIFEPKGGKGIKVSDLLTVNDLTYTFKAADLDE